MLHLIIKPDQRASQTIRIEHRHPYALTRERTFQLAQMLPGQVSCELPVNIVQATLGDRIEVPTLDGPVDLSIPPGTQYGQAFRLHGRGMPNVRSGRRGDQFVVVQVIVPKDLTLEQKSLLQKVGGLTGKPEKVSKSFFQKLRDAISID